MKAMRNKTLRQLSCIWMYVMLSLSMTSGNIQFISAARAAEADPSIAAFVQHVYGAYQESPRAPPPFRTTASIHEVFSQRLAALLVQSQKLAERRHSVGCLLSDPLIDAQDWEISKFHVESQSAGPDRATSVVSFVNFSEPKTITLDLLKSASTWRIDDVRSEGPGKSLAEWLQACLAKVR